MDPRQLLEQFLGTDPNQTAARGSASSPADPNQSSGGLGDLVNKIPGGTTGGLIAGGVLGLLLGSKKARKAAGHVAGGAIKIGGAAALGALAYRAYQNWQTDQNAPGGAARPATSVPAAGAPAELPPQAQKFLPAAAPAKDGRPFELALITAMIAAANADGHIDAKEQRTIFDQVGQLPLSAEEKGFVFDTLNRPPGLQDIADLANGPEQATELYLASRLAIDPDLPSERMYLEALASRLSLPKALVDQLETQATAAQAAPA